MIRELGIRPLKVQAGRNLVIRLTEVSAVKSAYEVASCMLAVRGKRIAEAADAPALCFLL